MVDCHFSQLFSCSSLPQVVLIPKSLHPYYTPRLLSDLLDDREIKQLLDRFRETGEDMPVVVWSCEDEGENPFKAPNPSVSSGSCIGAKEGTQHYP